MNMKFGGATQSNWVVPANGLTRRVLNSNNAPSPDNGVRSSEKAEMRRVLIGLAAGPGPGSTLPDTFQLPAVSPASCTGGSWNVTILSSKVKSPWNPISFLFGSISEVFTAATKSLLARSTAAFGSAIVATVAPASAALVPLVSLTPLPAASCDGPPSGRWTNPEATSPKISAS